MTDWATVIQQRRRFAIELLYSDHEGGQRTISRFSVTPRDAGDDPSHWLCSVGRHRNLDRPDPRSAVARIGEGPLPVSCGAGGCGRR
jgi:hypothetical protein